MMRFAPMLRLDLRHDYHGAAPPPLALDLDAATRRLAARRDLRLRLADGLVEIFAADDRTALRQLAAEDALAATFRIRARIPSLVTVTAALAEAQGRLLVVDAGPAARGPLTPGPTVTAADLSPLVEGGLVTPADLARPPLAIVRLALDPEARDAAVALTFGAVARHWTYHVIGGAPEAAYRVRDRRQALDFEPLGRRTMSNGAPAQSFRSSAPIPSEAWPAGRFELVSDGPFGPRVVVPVLPCPRPGPGASDPGGGASPVAEIFVNLW